MFEKYRMSLLLWELYVKIIDIVTEDDRLIELRGNYCEFKLEGKGIFERSITIRHKENGINAFILGEFSNLENERGYHYFCDLLFKRAKKIIYNKDKTQSDRVKEKFVKELKKKLENRN